MTIQKRLKRLGLAVHHLAVVSILTSSLGCYSVVPPPAPPQAGSPPDVEVPSLGPGEGVVLIDADRPARVIRINASEKFSASGSRGGWVQGYGEMTSLLCPKTPCAVTGQIGHPAEIRLVDKDDQAEHVAQTAINFSRTPSALRVKLGRNEPGNVVLFALSVTALAVGAGLATAGGTVSAVGGSDAGPVLLGSGAAGVGLGIFGMMMTRPSLQKHSETTWSLRGP